MIYQKFGITLMRFGLKIKPKNIIMNYWEVAKNYPKMRIQEEITLKLIWNFMVINQDNT